MFTAWKWGFLPAFFATILSAIAIDYWLIPPGNSFEVSPADLGTLFLFSFVGTAMAYFIHQQEHERSQAVTFHSQLQRLHKLSTRLLGEETFEAVLQRALMAAVELLKRQKGPFSSMTRKPMSCTWWPRSAFMITFYKSFNACRWI